MPRYTLSLLGIDLNFSTDAHEERIEVAQRLVEERFHDLSKNGNNISKERLLICLALGLADDYLESTLNQERLEAKIGELVGKIGKAL